MKFLNGKFFVILISMSFCLSITGFAFASSNAETFGDAYSNSWYSKSFFGAQKRKKKSKARRNLIKGPRGGCYYINRNGRKTYVARGACK